MAINPLMLMGGMGGPPPAPMAGPGLPGGPPDPTLSGLAMAQQTPPPQGEMDAIKDARMKAGFAMSRVWTRSPDAAKHLADAVKALQRAEESMQKESQKAVPMPPDLGLSGGPVAGGALGQAGPF